MPGFIAAVYVSPSDKVGVGILTNSSSAALGELAKKLVAATVEQWPAPPAPWKVEEPPPDDVLPLLGIWFMEGAAFTMRWKDGKLDARFALIGDTLDVQQLGAGTGVVAGQCWVRRWDRAS